MNKVIAWIKHEPVILSFLVLVGGNLATDIEQGRITLGLVSSAILAAVAATIRSLVSPVTKP